jgi:hypothetical protein
MNLSREVVAMNHFKDFRLSCRLKQFATLSKFLKYGFLQIFRIINYIEMHIYQLFPRLNPSFRKSFFHELLQKTVTKIRFFCENISLFHKEIPVLSNAPGHTQNNADGSINICKISVICGRH